MCGRAVILHSDHSAASALNEHVRQALDGNLCGLKAAEHTGLASTLDCPVSCLHNMLPKLNIEEKRSAAGIRPTGYQRRSSPCFAWVIKRTSGYVSADMNRIRGFSMASHALKW